MIRLRRRHGIAGTILIVGLAVGLAAAVAAQSGSKGSAALAAVTPVQGTDVSSIQGASTGINWPDVAGAERFIAVKATEGNYYTDPDYAGDLTSAAAQDMYVMPYVFANPYQSNASNPNAGNGWGTVQADDGWKTISAGTPAYKASPLMLPVAVDLENDPYVNIETDSNQCYGLSQANMVSWISAFISEMKKDSGKTPIIYTTTDWWDSCTGDSSAFTADPLWIASYGVSVPSIPSVWGNLTIWQYSGGSSVPGINGAVDLDSLGPIQATRVGTTIRAEQLQTLSSLAAQTLPSGYTATGLPPGITISATGQLTGTPTSAGSYGVTVTPPAGSAPASIPFQWNVYGAITLAAPAVTSVARQQVSHQVIATGPDQNAGVAPTLTAAGLPPGLSMNSAGLITGAPTEWGTFTVTVSASDTLGGTGSASFTWTVKMNAVEPSQHWQRPPGPITATMGS